MSMIDPVQLTDVMTTADLGNIVAPEGTWIGDLQAWVQDLPEALQWLGIIVISAIPFVESYGGAFIGLIVGMPWWGALISAVIGNAVAVVILVYGTHWIRTSILKRTEPKELSERQQARRARAKQLFDKFGVPGVSLLGPFALPSQITAPLMASFGANRHAIAIWMLVSIILWGGLFILLGFGFLQLVG